MSRKRVLIVEPFLGGSHQAWAESYRAVSRHEVSILGLSGHHWKWRMHGGAVTLARRFNELETLPDVILATDMLDLTTFLALAPEARRAAVGIYFHENQLMYPWSQQDRDRKRGTNLHYGFINFVSCLAADRVFFNSSFHREGFWQEVRRMLAGYPDHQELGQVDAAEAKSEVLPLGLHLESAPERRKISEPPLILWNHRWEHDKNPEGFFCPLFRLAEAGGGFRLAVLGESYAMRPPIFDEAKERLAKHIVAWGYAESREEYRAWLRAAHILPVTSRHDFFGASVVEAIAAGVMPLLPNRLAYPEHLPPELHRACLYASEEEYFARLKQWLEEPPELGETLLEWVRTYDWKHMGPVYDKAMETLCEIRG